ncbi:MAG TPA: type II toxin-antitoxin system VapC family toxin [Rhizomicrobium sp.]|jgi:predicted nucleic acid-binding protein|nr:type II toxin-antitoxin system VapC family toxin [Rhizomicrobium sp.]
MYVLDASAAIEILLGTEIGARWRDRTMSQEAVLFAPHLIDIEVMSGLRRMASSRVASAVDVNGAVQNFDDLRIERYSHSVLLPRIWELRQSISAYDAAYVALAEILDLPLLTGDAKLSRSQGHLAKIELLS